MKLSIKSIIVLSLILFTQSTRQLFESMGKENHSLFGSNAPKTSNSLFGGSSRPSMNSMLNKNSPKPFPFLNNKPSMNSMNNDHHINFNQLGEKVVKSNSLLGGQKATNNSLFGAGNNKITNQVNNNKVSSTVLNNVQKPSLIPVSPKLPSIPVLNHQNTQVKLEKHEESILPKPQILLQKSEEKKPLPILNIQPSQPQKTEISIKDKIINSQKEIQKLKKDMSNLLEVNSKLKRRYDLTEKLQKKDDEFTSNIVSFIQKNEMKVKNLKNEIKHSKNEISSKLTEKEEELSRMYSSANESFKSLQKQLKEVEERITEIKSEEKTKFKEMKNKLDLDHLTVEKKLDVDGNAFVENTVSTNQVDLGNIKISSSDLVFYNENTKFIIGNEVISLRELVENMNVLSELENKCGEDLTKCKIVSKEEVARQQKKQEKILKDLKSLRAETEKILSHK
jgi:hypothetical protein